jgi:amino acid transporter
VDLRRLRAGEWLAAAGGVGMIVALMLPWYDIGGAPVSGYEALTVIDVLLTLIALLAIALAVLQATRDSPALPVGAAVLTASFGILGVLLVLFRLIDDPTSGSDLRVGAWIGLVAALAIEASGWLSLDNEYVTGLPPDVEPELRPTPRPTAQA